MGNKHQRDQRKSTGAKAACKIIMKLTPRVVEDEFFQLEPTLNCSCEDERVKRSCQSFAKCKAGVSIYGDRS